LRAVLRGLGPPQPDIHSTERIDTLDVIDDSSNLACTTISICRLMLKSTPGSAQSLDPAPEDDHFIAVHARLGISGATLQPCALTQAACQITSEPSLAFA
jgi:hypothetical protein